MKFQIAGLPVFFPYPFIYPEQLKYMKELKKAIDAKGHCLLEMPTGTGKTPALLSLIMSHQQHVDAVPAPLTTDGPAPRTFPRLIYLSRTVPEVVKVLTEVKRTISCLQHYGALKRPLVCLGLSSRANLCINQKVVNSPTVRDTDSACRDLTASWVRTKAHLEPDIETCPFFEEFDKHGTELQLPPGVYNLDDLRETGRQQGLCPYYLARRAIQYADVVVCCYPYVLDPKISAIVGLAPRAGDIVIFDEAHNIDESCIECFSVHVNRAMVDACMGNLHTLSQEIQRAKNTDARKLEQEYQRMVTEIAQHWAGRGGEELLGNPALTGDIIREAVPGSIRKAEHFLGFLKRFLEYIRLRLNSDEAVHESPLAFRHHLYQTTQISDKPLRFLTDRLQSLLRTLELPNMGQFAPLLEVANLGGFSVLVEVAEGAPVPADGPTPAGSTAGGEGPAAAASAPPAPPPPAPSAKGLFFNRPILHFCCHEASLALGPVFGAADTVVITSGTLSPLGMYPKILNFAPAVALSLPMSLARECVVTRGADQVPLSSKFDARGDHAVVRNYGALLVDLCSVTPDGLVAFFPSYKEIGIFAKVLQHKLLFFETPDPMETSLALANYRKPVIIRRITIMGRVAGGGTRQVSEGIDFEGPTAGVWSWPAPMPRAPCPQLPPPARPPAQSTAPRGSPGAPVVGPGLGLQARLDYLRLRHGVKEAEFLVFDAMRAAAQCMGRVLRSKSDYGLMVFADKRFSAADKRSKLPQWLGEHLREGRVNIGTDTAKALAAHYFREMAQPIPWRASPSHGIPTPPRPEDQLGTALLTESHVSAIEARDRADARQADQAAAQRRAAEEQAARRRQAEEERRQAAELALRTGEALTREDLENA
ncbi:putative General transcription and DNA repair factor IIH helicase subunit XPD [Paratrimastix pyriformis]|uniref:DNA 5'-3' helicase n=1 Tax=Paratrimastix pyriformis TaxID=342808 RepID=A0ABQ8UII8_9EUKA|nr:putative General transcription and DNA repair factor IIH helicase subunit XPD [Paratrimastix pyriformis]